MPPTLLTALLALHRLWLQAYPPHFRSVFGDEMHGVFAEALAQAAERGPAPAAQFVAREWLALPGQALYERWRAERPAQLAGGAGQAEAAMLVRRVTRGVMVTTLLLGLLGLALWLLWLLGWGANWGLTLPTVLVLTLAAGGLAWTLAPQVRRSGVRLWLGVGLATLAGLLWPTAHLVEYRLDAWPPLLRALLVSWPAVALGVAAVLLARGLAERPGQPAALCLGLSALLVAKALHNLYWLLVWDATYDPLGILWLIWPGLTALGGGVGLATLLPGRAKVAGLYGLLVPAVLVAFAAQTAQLDFRQWTADRAARVNGALAAFYAREGRYPQRLSELTPWYLLTQPEPLIINGQGWCYDGGADGYQLGYVDRDHWSSPTLSAHVYATAGATAALPPLCAAELAALAQPRVRFSGGWAWPLPWPSPLAGLEVGLSRAQVLQRVSEAWHRDSCAPPPGHPGGYAYTDLFWTGTAAAAQATVIAVHYGWEPGARAWTVTSAEVVATEDLAARFGDCTSVDLSGLP